MLAIFVEVVRDVVLTVAWLAAALAMVGAGFALVLVALALALRPTWQEAGSRHALAATWRLLLGRSPAAPAGLASLTPANGAPPPDHTPRGERAPHLVPDAAEEARWQA